MRTLVTGGAGFIGSNLVDALLDRGDEVTVLDDLSSGRRANLDDALARGATLREADVRDAAAVGAAFATARPQLVFHLAAQVDVRRSLADPAHDAHINVLGTINVLEAAREHGVERLVNTSTGGAIYGDTDVYPTPESEPALPMAAYGQSKLCAEQYCALMDRVYGLPAVTLRYGNVYGPRQDPKGEAGVIAIFAGRLLDGEDPVVYGDGTQTRDYTFVRDIVAANLAAAETPDARGAFNIGTGSESSVLDVLAAMREAAGIDPGAFQPRLEPRRLGELDRSSLDVTKARDELGFTARTPLVEGMRSVLYALRQRS
jgi:UDP-glucose 4-epimerase